MKRLALILGGLVLAMLLLFGVAQAFGMEAMLQEAFSTHASSDARAALLGIALLVLDVFLPVPSTFVMIYLGWALGTVQGTLVSVLGCAAAALLAYGLGARGGRLLDRLLGPEDRERAHRLLEDYGLLAIVITRPIPMFAEAVALLAGAGRIGVLRVVLAASAGALPVALVHAWAGSRSAETESLSPGTVALMFALVIGMSAIFWFIGKRWQTR